MSKLLVNRKPFIIGVMGSHKGKPAVVKNAYRLGEGIARKGHVLLTGGGGGLMEAASEGAHRAGGFVIGILPSERKFPLKGYPNKFVDISIYTGMSDARNVINAKTPHLMVAMSGGSGTLSEIAFALKSGTPVIGLHCPEFKIDEEGIFIRVETVEEVLEEIDKFLKSKKT